MNRLSIWIRYWILILIPGTAFAQQGQVLQGQVLDRDTQMPLPGAHVLIQDVDPVMGTTTDTEGRFRFPEVELGRRTVQVRFLGYETVTLHAVLVTSSKVVDLIIPMQEAVLTGEEIVVEYVTNRDRAVNDMAAVSGRSFSVEDTRRYAGGVDDPARMAAVFAGTATGDVANNALVIRGNTPRFVQWRIEGIPVPNPNHFADIQVAGGGGVTMFSGQVLGQADVFTGAFPAEYGNALGGVFDVFLKSGNPEQREHTFQLGLMGIDGASEGPVLKGRAGTYVFNYRYSTLALLLPLLSIDDPTRYQDLSFKLRLPTRRAGRFEIWGLGGLDRQQITPSDSPSDWTYELDREDWDMRLGMGAVGLTHQMVLGSRSFLRTGLATTVQHTGLDVDRIDDELMVQENLRVDNTERRITFSSVLHTKFNPGHINRTGMNVHKLYYALNVRSAHDRMPPLVPVSEGDGSSTLLQIFSQSGYNLTGRIRLNLGIHGQYFALTGRSRVEPRLGLAWTLDENQSISIGYGLHSQTESLPVYFVRQADHRPNQHLDFSGAHHGVVGYDRKLNRDTRLKLEAYMQALHNVPVIADSSFSIVNVEQDWTFQEALINTGTGTNYGVELTLERFFRDGFYYLITGSIFSSNYTGGDGIKRSTRHNRRYVFNTLFGREFQLGSENRPSLFGFNVRLAALGGVRYSPVDPLLSQQRKEVVFDERRAFQEQAPPVFLLDLTLTYRKNGRRTSSIWALQVKNALAARTFGLDYNYQTRAVEEVNERLVLPVLSYKLEF